LARCIISGKQNKMYGFLIAPFLSGAKKFLTAGSASDSVTLRQERAENTTLMVAAVALGAGVIITLLVKGIK